MKHLLPVFLLTFLLASCAEDDGPGPGNVLPSSNITTLTSTTISANGSFSVTLSALEGDSPLNTLTILKDASTVSEADITIDGSVAAANPILLFGGDKTSFTYTIDIQTDLGAGESATYSFIIDADNNDNTSESVVISVDNTPPVLDVTGGVSDYLAEPAALITIPLDAMQGSSALSTLHVYQNDSTVAADRISFGATIWTDNPRILTGGEENGFMQDLVLEAQMNEDTSRYMIILEDLSGQSDTVAFYVVVEDPGTPVDSIKTNLMLLNAGGPVGQGGVNLITGESTGSNDADAHLVDEGIDTDEPNATNWLQKISAGNATETLKLATGADYDNTSKKEEIEAIFNAGTDVTTSDKLVGGEIFVLKTLTGAFVLVRIDAVNVTVDDNTDSYTISAKF